jgi:hypothetical protein
MYWFQISYIVKFWPSDLAISISFGFSLQTIRSLCIGMISSLQWDKYHRNDAAAIGSRHHNSDAREKMMQKNAMRRDKKIKAAL